MIHDNYSAYHGQIIAEVSRRAGRLAEKIPHNIEKITIIGSKYL